MSSVDVPSMGLKIRVPVMRFSLIFFCSVAVFRTLPWPPQEEEKILWRANWLGVKSKQMLSFVCAKISQEFLRGQLLTPHPGYSMLRHIYLVGEDAITRRTSGGFGVTTSQFNDKMVKGSTLGDDIGYGKFLKEYILLWKLLRMKVFMCFCSIFCDTWPWA